MQHEVKKITQIVNEIVSLLMLNGSDAIEVKINRSQDQVRIQIFQHDSTFTQEKVDQFQSELNIQRQHEIEGYYWQLVGDNECDEELCLVGAMIDTAKVTLEKGILHIDLIRKYDE